jgi:hypothetical protein
MLLRAIESPAFIDLLRLLDPAINIPRRTKLRNTLDSKFQAVQDNLLLGCPPQGKISLTLDAWTSPNHLPFLGVIGSYITSGWKRKEVLLAFGPLSGAHSGFSFAEIVFRILQTHDLHNLLLAITTDNASNNKTLCESLSDSLKTSKRVSWSAEQNHLPCLAHVIQLVVKKVVESLDIGSSDEILQTSTDETINATLSKRKDVFGKTLHKVSIIIASNGV